MAKYLVLYNSVHSAKEQRENGDPEVAAKGKEAWMAWAKEAGDAVIDLGMPLEPMCHVGLSHTGESNSQVAGWSMMEGDSVQAIAALMQQHPHIQVDGNTIDVFEVLPMPGS